MQVVGFIVCIYILTCSVLFDVSLESFTDVLNDSMHAYMYIFRQSLRVALTSTAVIEAAASICMLASCSPPA